MSPDVNTLQDSIMIGDTLEAYYQERRADLGGAGGLDRPEGLVMATAR